MKTGEENVVERLPLAWLIKTVLEGVGSGVASTSCCCGPLYPPFVLYQWKRGDCGDPEKMHSDLSPP